MYVCILGVKGGDDLEDMSILVRILFLSLGCKCMTKTFLFTGSIVWRMVLALLQPCRPWAVWIMPALHMMGVHVFFPKTRVGVTKAAQKGKEQGTHKS